MSADNATWYDGYALEVEPAPALGLSFLVQAPVKPTMLRYTANKAFPQCAVFSNEGLPALPFQLAID